MGDNRSRQLSFGAASAVAATAAAREEVARRQIVNHNDEPIWFYVETVRCGEVIARKDVPVVTESQRNEVYATA